MYIDLFISLSLPIQNSSKGGAQKALLLLLLMLLLMLLLLLVVVVIFVCLCVLFEIHQRGVQWKQGVVISMTSYTSLLYDTTPHPLHPPPTATPCNEYPPMSGPQRRQLRVR